MKSFWRWLHGDYFSVMPCPDDLCSGLQQQKSVGMHQKFVWAVYTVSKYNYRYRLCVFFPPLLVSLTIYNFLLVTVCFAES